MFTFNRPGLDLNGSWKFCPDPMQRCTRQKWWKNPGRPNQIFPSWDPEGLWDIQVPGTWKKQFPALEWYDGHAVYMKDFEIQDRSGGEAYLVFDGIVYASQIYLNGQKLAVHDWGYSPFAVRVTDVLEARNRLFVLVDNHLSAKRVPGEIFDWNNDGGIINSVRLVFVPEVFVENFRVATVLAGDRVQLDVDVWLSSRDIRATEAITVEIPELGLIQTTSVAIGSTHRFCFETDRDEVSLWNPEQPRLYEIRISTARETISDEIGLREIKTDGNRILLNGQPIRLYGVCVHSEYPGTGRTATPEGVDEMVAAAKDLGLNFLRCAHYPYSELFGRAMDRAGLLWWQEVPAYWLFSVREEAVSRLALGMLDETIRRDWNRASLIFWSVSNECCWRNPEDPEEHNYAYWFKAARMVRELDPTRLLTCAEAGNMITASEGWTPARGDYFVGASDESEPSRRPMHADEFYALFDVLAANLYVDAPGDEARLYPQFARLFSRYNKPLLMSEFGSVSLRDSGLPQNLLGSEERHAEMLERAYEVFALLPEISGYCPWILTDGRAPIHWRWYNEGQAIYRHGLLDSDWRPKQAYSAVKAGVAKLKRLLR